MSYRPITLWLTFLAVTSADAQLEAIRTRTDTGWVTTHFYLSGEVSATEWQSSSADKSGFTCFKKDGSIQWEQEWAGLFSSVGFKAWYQSNGAVNHVELREPTKNSDTQIRHTWNWSPYAAEVIVRSDTINSQHSDLSRSSRVRGVSPQAPSEAEDRLVTASEGPSAATAFVPSYWRTEVFVIKGKNKVSSVEVQTFEQNGTLRKTEYEFGWLDTLGIGWLYSNVAFPEAIDLGIVAASTNEREIKKRRSLPVTIGAQVDVTAYYRRYYLRLGN